MRRTWKTEAWDEIVRSRRHGAMPPFTSQPHPGKGNLPASGPWMPLFIFRLCGGRRQAEPSDGLYRYAIRQMPKESNLHLQVLETCVLPLYEASRCGLPLGDRVTESFPPSSGGILPRRQEDADRRSGSRTRLSRLMRPVSNRCCHPAMLPV